MKLKKYIPLILITVALIASGCSRVDFYYSTTDIYTDNYDNSGIYPVTAGASVPGGAYMMRINYSSDLTQFHSVDDKHDYEGRNKPVSIDITCVQNFDSLHPANTSLNSYFIYAPSVGATLDGLIHDFPDTEPYYRGHDPDDIWLMQAPAADGNYNFVVTIRFDDGIIAHDTTETVFLDR